MNTGNTKVGSNVVLTAEAAEMVGRDANIILRVCDVRRGNGQTAYLVAPEHGTFVDAARAFMVFPDEIREVGR